MAILFLEVKSIGRSAGRRATAAAAYRAGERIRDERSGRQFNHSNRQDVLHTEILLPSHLDANEAEWARNRGRLWNAAEHAENRRDSRVAREFQVALPHELDAHQRLDLARAFSREIADRYNIAVDLAIHGPRPGGDPRNYHAHLLATTREITTAGLGQKAGLDLRAGERYRRGLLGNSRELAAIRERWAALTNESLRAAHLEARVDHRTLDEQGINREPRARIPWGAYMAEKRGLRSEIAERVRERYRTKVQDRRERAAKHAGRALATDNDINPRQFATPPKNLEEVRLEARENWLQYRSVQVQETRAKALGRRLEVESAQKEATDDLAL